jgi:transposase
MAQKECPLCGGNPETATRTVREWICPDCDNFEEAGEGE